MRVMFVVSEWPTHYYSLVPLGWAVQAAGHELRVLCAPSQADSVSRAGLMPVPLLGGMDIVLRNRLEYFQQAKHGCWPYGWLPVHPLSGKRIGSLEDFDISLFIARDERRFAESSRGSFDRALAYARAWLPDLVVHDPVALEALLISRVLNVPAALNLWGLVGTDEPEHLRLLGRDLFELFPSYGLSAPDATMVDLVIDPSPTSLAAPVSAERLPIRFVPYNGPVQDAAFSVPSTGRPRVVLVWSTVLRATSGSNSFLLPAVLKGLTQLDVDVVVTATAEDLATLGPVPSSVTKLTRAPLNLLLSECSAVIHHGGAGSTMTSLLRGIPQIALTCAWEQTANGERVASAGAGRHLFAHEASAAAIEEAAAAVLWTKSYRDRAVELRREMLTRPSPTSLVETLEQRATDAA